MIRRRAALLALLPLLPAAAAAHDFLLKPLAPQVAEGQPAGVQALLTEVYLRGDVVLPESRVQVALVTPGGRHPVALAPDPAAKALAGAAPAPTGRAFVIAGQTGRYRSKTAEGDKPLPKSGAPGATETLRAEAFSKALVNLAPGDDGFATRVGHRLEILALDNPAALGPDGALRVQVLFDGRPLAVRLDATHDGYSTADEAFATHAESGPDGIATLRLTRPGVLWAVRARHGLVEAAPEHDRYTAAATLVFPLP